jgi:hypothetical protein
MIAVRAKENLLRTVYSINTTHFLTIFVDRCQAVSIEVIKTSSSALLFLLNLLVSRTYRPFRQSILGLGGSDSAVTPNTHPIEARVGG